MSPAPAPAEPPATADVRQPVETRPDVVVDQQVDAVVLAPAPSQAAVAAPAPIATSGQIDGPGPAPATGAPHTNGAAHGNGAPRGNGAPHSNGAPHGNGAPYANGAPHGNEERSPGCTAPQLRRFIKSRPYVPMHELRRRFAIDGGEDDVTQVPLDGGNVYVGLPQREGSLLGELLRGGEIGYELSFDPRAPIVVGVYPMRPVPRP
jgi:hypothetical protein